MVLLSLESENGSVLTYRLAKSQITVGSSSRNDVVVRSPGVADRHLVMRRNGDLFTFVTVDRQTVVLNGERRSRGVLNPGDRVRIGAMTLVFRSSDSSGMLGEGTSEGEAAETLPVAGHELAEPIAFLSDPAGFPELRRQLFDLFSSPRQDCLQRLVGMLHDALAGVEIAIVAVEDGREPMALASVWSADLPRPPAAALADLLTPGRYAQLTTAGGGVVILPIVTPDKALPAFLAARTAGPLADEGLALLGEVVRLLGLRWQAVGSESPVPTRWEAEARQRLETVLPGSSQAMQVLRAGLIASAHGHEPALICGGNGVGRTEAARILATLGASVGHPLVIVEGGTTDADALRHELFAGTGHPSFASNDRGAIGRARGGMLVLRNADRMPLSVQSELAALIAAQEREPGDAPPIRWALTCGEDPLALVQQGNLSSQLFMVFSRRMLRVPRLAERREDLPLLIAGLLRRVAADQQKTLRGIALECLNVLLAHPFPGEMAELVGEINRLVTATPDGDMVRCDEAVATHAAVGGTASVDMAAEVGDIVASDNLKVAVPKVERLLIDRVMRRVKGNQSKGARLLGISRGALIAKLKEYGVADYRFLRHRKKT